MILSGKITSLVAALFLLVTVQTGWANPDDFSVESATGTNRFKLSEARGKLVALHFLLKTECPYCLRHTREYAKKSATDSRVVHVFLKPDSEAEVRAWASKLGGESLKLTIYRDPDAALARAYNVPGGYKFHGQAVHYPALVLLDANGKEVFRYVGKDNTDRLAYEKFSAKLQEVTQSPPH
jgi:peroxiredoxin Q/BCP